MLGRASSAQSDGVNALWNIAYDVGLGLGALTYGGLAVTFGSQPATIAISIVIAVAATVGFLLFEPMQRPSSRQPGTSRDHQTAAVQI
jgi:predicted MFS family arabinose efflux permease